VLATPQQISLHAELEVTSQQLRKALETVEEKSKELGIRKFRETEIEGLKKNWKNIIKAEKDKRLVHLEKRITIRLEKTGVVICVGRWCGASYYSPADKLTCRFRSNESAVEEST
jgi:hypothetical protein